MPGTIQPNAFDEQLRAPGVGRGESRVPHPALGGDGLAFSPGVYAVDDLGRFVFRGIRPDGPWHGHGYTDCSPWTIRAGRFVRIVVRKHRWLHTPTGRTVTSHPPALLPRRRACVLVVACLLFAALTAPVGVHSREPVAEKVRSTRQVQRDLAAALELAAPTQQAVRHALIDISATRPAELLWKGGLDPPLELARRCRHSNAPWLWTALEMLRRGAEQLEIPTSRLLAEARGRWTGSDRRFLI
jgi:hypothetical protein